MYSIYILFIRQPWSQLGQRIPAINAVLQIFRFVLGYTNMYSQSVIFKTIQ